MRRVGLAVASVACLACRATLEPIALAQAELFEEPSHPAPPAAGACPEFHEDRKVAEAQAEADPLGPVPGSDALPTLLAIEDRSVIADIIAWQVYHRADGVRPVHVSTSREPAVVDLGGRGAVEVRVLVRFTVSGGLFDDVSYCRELTGHHHRPEGPPPELVVILEDPPRADDALPRVRLDPEPDQVFFGHDSTFDH